MRILSVNVGKPQQILAGGRVVTTSIFKNPVDGPVTLRGYNLEGDRQADPRVHGGPWKAVYLYPAEHHPFWCQALSTDKLPPAAFGENLTTEGLTEDAVCIGDQYRFGSAVLQVAQPRMPCFKLALRFERADMVERFWASGFSGIYFSVVTEGVMQAGDAVVKLADGPERVTVSDVVRLYKGEEWSHELRQRALRSPLRGSWKEKIRARLVTAE